MMPRFLQIGDISLHYALRNGDAGGVPVVFLNSLGTDFRIWEGVADLLPDHPTLMLDKRGHGLSDMGPISIDILARDVAGLMDHLGLTHAVICGVSVGGLIAQALVALRPDLVAGLVLSNTGARIGDTDTWNARIAAVTEGGILPMAAAILERWFSAAFRETRAAELAGYRNMLTRTTAQGYAGTCAAIRDTDLGGSTRRITVPTVCIGGSEDLATPPALVTALCDMIAGATLCMIDGVGHLPCIETPRTVADQVRHILQAVT